MANSALAEDTIIDELNEHRFLSAIITDQDTTSIYHEVCNLTDEASAFFWSKAGLGIDSLNQLNPKLCARRTQKGVKSLDRGESPVVFQDGTSGEIGTIYQCYAHFGIDSCDDSFWGNAAAQITELSIFLSTPDGNNLQMETVTIGIRSLNNGLAEVFIESSDGVEHIAVIVNSEDASIDEIRDLLDSGEGLQINTFGYFKEIGDVEPGFLTENIPSQSPTLMFKGLDGIGMRHYYKMKDINRLGQLISILILDGDRAVARAEAPVPLE
ncbi:hypothetical protein [Oceaniglobus roseus]|uniref:hypothetical protein n=1 Tax=Oceaniglobus roseus TaxID=1737570 RepID=UPI0012FFE5CD|nr:hypothetical protein [Kandeliimicrobium roseum]